MEYFFFSRHHNLCVYLTFKITIKFVRKKGKYKYRSNTVNVRRYSRASVNRRQRYCCVNIVKEILHHAVVSTVTPRYGLVFIFRRSLSVVTAAVDLSVKTFDRKIMSALTETICTSSLLVWTSKKTVKLMFVE